MKLSGLRGRNINLKSIRIALTTDDIATLLGVSNDVIRQRILTGKIQLSGDGVKDFKTLAKLVYGNKK